MSFTLPKSRMKEFELWADYQDKKVANSQGENFPNYGASGGAYSYIFTPTSIGTIIKVKNSITGDTLDLTEDF